MVAREDAVVLGAHEARARHAMDRRDTMAAIAQRDARGTEDIVEAILDEVARERRPQVRHHALVRIERIHARAIDLDHALAKHDEEGQVEIAIGQVAARPARVDRRQDAVRPDDVAGLRVTCDEMVAVLFEALVAGAKVVVAHENHFTKAARLGDARLVADDSHLEAGRFRLHASRLRCHRSLPRCPKLRKRS
jgi:hypothetical protein